MPSSFLDNDNVTLFFEYRAFSSPNLTRSGLVQRRRPRAKPKLCPISNLYTSRRQQVSRDPIPATLLFRFNSVCCHQPQKRNTMKRAGASHLETQNLVKLESDPRFPRAHASNEGQAHASHMFYAPKLPAEHLCQAHEHLPRAARPI